MSSFIVVCAYFLTTQEVCSTYAQITRNHHLIDTAYAKHVSELVVSTSKKYNIRPDIYTAILLQESRLKLDAVNKRSKDYGIAQINERTAKSFKFCKKKLVTDLPYSIEAGAIVLSDFKRRWFKKEGYNYWTRYNTSHPGKRLVYKNKVLRFY